MRTLGAGNSAQPASGFGPGALTAVKVEVANAADTLVDLSEFVVSLEYEQTTDEIVDAATVVFRRLEGASSLAPLMTASPPVAVGRRIVVSINPGSGTYKDVFRGQIDDVDWPERFGDVTVKCRDRAGLAADTWIEDAVQYSTTAGATLESVMQAVVDDNLATTYTLNFPVATSSVVQHVAGDPPYGPTEQSTLDALRALAESIGWTIRWRHFDTTPTDWKWTVFQPSRSKTVADHTFATSAYWDVVTMQQSITDIRNVVEVEYLAGGDTRARVVSEDATSITAYGRRYMKISEGSDSPINTLALATALANAALSDLKSPNALLEIQCRYFWPGEVGVDLYTFTANNNHFSSDQTLAAMAFRHRIAIGEQPTTWILCRGKPSGGALMWRRRASDHLPTTIVPDLALNAFTEVSRTDTQATVGWSGDGDIDEIWIYTSTPTQPLASDPWAAFTGVPHIRLTGTTANYTFSVPGPGLVTYALIVPVGVRAATIVRGKPHQITIQADGVPLTARATLISSTASSVVVRVAVIRPHAGGNVTITYDSTGITTITPASGQTILAAAVTSSLATTGYVDFTVTRPAPGANGRVTFTCAATDSISDVDAVDIPAFDGIPQGSVAIGADGSVEITVDGAPWVASHKYSTSTSAFPSEATVRSSGTTVNGRQMSASLAASTLALGATIFVTILPYSATGAGGVEGSSIKLRATRHDTSATKTVYWSAGAITLGNWGTNSAAFSWAGTGVIQTASSAFPGPICIDAWVDLQVPQGCTLTNVSVDAYAGSGTTADVSVNVRYTSATGTFTSLGTDITGALGWEVLSVAVSDSTTGRRYQLLFTACATVVGDVGNSRIAGFNVTYTMPSTVNSL